MTIAEDLLRRHIETLVADNARWQMLLAEDVVWELPFAMGVALPSFLARAESATAASTLRHRHCPSLL
jgi:uncharacterized protein